MDSIEHFTQVFQNFLFSFYESNSFRYLRYAVVLGVSSFAARKTMLAIKRRRRIAESKDLKDTVILYQFPRGITAPNISPYPLKLETYMRMAKIPYQVRYSDFIGPKGKCPYIIFNGKEIGDSQLIIEFLNKEFKVNLDKDLDEETKAVGHAFRIMAENYLYWAFALNRWVYDKDQSILKLSKWPFPLKYIIFPAVKSNVKKSAWYHGIGRHSQEEVNEMAIQNLAALSTYLGEKKYFLGDKPSEVDCALFGLLCQVIWVSHPCEIQYVVMGEYSNLVAYCNRIKEQFWPDWNNCLSGHLL